jgi:twinkle protein
MINLAVNHGWKFAVSSFENPTDEHRAKLSAKYLGLPFWDGLTPRMTETELMRGLSWLRERFFFMRFTDESPTIDAILETARAAVIRHGIRGLVIDPYNEIESRRPAAMTETEYVSEMLGKVKRFAQNHGVHVWFIAHPAKMLPGQDGKRRVPTLYDISGSANWINKADNGIVVHLDPNHTPPQTEIYIRKVRHQPQHGQRGVVTLKWDRKTGRYSDPAEHQRANQKERWQQ